MHHPLFHENNFYFAEKQRWEFCANKTKIINNYGLIFILLKKDLSFREFRMTPFTQIRYTYTGTCTRDLIRS